MPRSFTQKTRDLVATVFGREPTGEVAPPRTGTDRSSMRHMLALIIGTAAIMIVGLLVAYLEDDDGAETAATPSVVTSKTPSD